MNVHHAIKIIRINYTSYGISYSFVNIDTIKKNELLLKIQNKEKEQLIPADGRPPRCGPEKKNQ